MNTRDSKEDRLTLELLDAIERNSDLSQRHLARQMGVALGLTNSYLKRCVRKGFVKIAEAPANRYLYYLTPIGFAEKSRLTARYLFSSLDFYREAGRSCQRVFAHCERAGLRRLLLCGHSDLAEIAVLRAMETRVEVIGLFDPRWAGNRFLSRPIWRSLDEAPAFDAVVVTCLEHTRRRYRELVGAIDEARVLVPDMLRIVTEAPARADAVAAPAGD